MIRVGIVCEGATDFITISTLLSEALHSQSIEVEFLDLHPRLDKMSERYGGWSNALLWLRNNPLKSRKNHVLGTGLFSGSLAWKKCDGIVVQLDCDCFEDAGFLNFVRDAGMDVDRLRAIGDRPTAMIEVLEHFSEIKSASMIPELHVLSAAVHNSESWCLAVLDESIANVESVDLTATNALLLSEFKTMPSAQGYSEERVLKSRNVRHEFCQKHKHKTVDAVVRSPSFGRLIDNVDALHTHLI